MRFARLDLERYGRFTDVQLDLPQAESDFHVIYGPNEAGKSTTRNALAELLFGVDVRTPYAFLHDYSELRLGALLESAHGALEVVRLKRIKNPLLDAAGNPVDADVWRQLLGATTDRPFYERMYSLDHEQLVAGGKFMLDSTTDVGRALFQAAAGLGHFSNVRATLGAEAGQWWAARARKDVRYFVAKSRYDEAAKALREHQLSENALKAMLTARNQAESRVDTARQQRVDAATRTALLERIRRVAPKLQQLAAAETECATVASVTLVPGDARDAFRTYTTQAAAADSAIRQLEESIEAQRARFNALIVDDDLLAHAAEIDVLASELSSVEAAFKDLPKRRVEREQLRREINAGLADLGLPEADPSDVPGRLLTAPQREHLRGLAEIHAENDREAGKHQGRVDAATNTLAALTAELERLSSEPVGTWSELIAGATAVLESANARQLAATLAAAEAKLRTALDALEWQGDAEELRGVSPPATAAIDAQLAAIAGHREQRVEIVRSRRAAAADLAQANAEIAARQTGAVPDASALVGARQARDELVEALVAGAARVDEQGGALRARVADADEIADRRYAEAEASATLDSLVSRQAGLRAKLDAFDAQVAALEQAEREIRERWARACGVAGMPSVEMEGAAVWIAGRLQALSALDESKRAQIAAAEFEAAATRQCERIAAALTRNRPDGTSTVDWLRTLVAEARDAQQRVTTQGARRAELLRQVTEQEGVIARELKAAAGLQTGVDAWRAKWAEACKAAELPVETLPRSLDRVLAIIEALRNKVASFTREQEARIAPMERMVSDFEARVADCTVRAAPSLAIDSPFDAVRMLAGKLQTARQANQSRSELRRSIEEQQTTLQTQDAKRHTAAAVLEPLMRSAGAATPEDLDAAIVASDRRRLAETAFSQLLNAVLELGDGKDLAQLRAEVESVGVEKLDALLEATKMQSVDAERAQTAAQEEAILTREKLRHYEGSDSAARAASAKLAAQREMVDAAEAYVGLHTQALLLDWALKRYREEKQAPLLQRASEYFAQLTCGEHVRLIADGDGTAVALSSRRAGPAAQKVPVDGMSDGTRDQLYLALRLAAVDLHLENNVALPFVADDLFINFDDTRARAALQAMATLGKRTQTLYFTHHRHLVDLAREAVGPSVNVVEL